MEKKKDIKKMKLIMITMTQRRQGFAGAVEETAPTVGWSICGSKFVTSFRGFSFDALQGEEKISYLNKLPAVTGVRELSYGPKAKFEPFAVHLN